MSLDWNAQNVKGFDKMSKNDRYFISYIMPWTLLGLGMRSVTKNNYKEVYTRMKFQKALGYSVFPTLEFDISDIQMAIGLNTNCETKTWLQFSKSLCKYFYKDTEKSIEHGTNERLPLSSPVNK